MIFYIVTQLITIPDEQPPTIVAKPELANQTQAPKQLQKTVVTHKKPRQPQPHTELTCLANNIYFEAGGESTDGKIAVANVTMNRVSSGSFPGTVCGVVYARNTKHCAFSWTCDSRDDTPPKNNNYLESLKIARMALKGVLHDITDGATHFHATHVRPRWANKMTPTTQIGGHIFYNSSI